MQTHKKPQTRAVAGLEVVEAVIFSLLVIGIISITAILIMTSFTPSIDLITSSSVNIVNETTATITQTGYTVAGATAYNFNSPTLVAVFKNTTNKGWTTAIPLTNVTISASGVVTNTTMTAYPNASVSYTYLTSSGNANAIANNISNANASFFGNSGTFFSILAVVVIIAMIALIVLYIRQFRGEGVRATA